MGKYDFLGPELIAAINASRQPVTPLQKIWDGVQSFTALRYNRNSHLFLKTKDDAALLLLWYRNLEAVELGTLYIKPQYRGTGVLDKVFAELFAVADKHFIVIVGTADKFEIDPSEEHLMFTSEFWDNPHTNFKSTMPITAEQNDRWLNRLITQYGFIQPKIEEDKYFVKRLPR